MREPTRSRTVGRPRDLADDQCGRPRGCTPRLTMRARPHCSQRRRDRDRFFRRPKKGAEQRQIPRASWAEDRGDSNGVTQLPRPQTRAARVAAAPNFASWSYGRSIASRAAPAKPDIRYRVAKRRPAKYGLSDVHLLVPDRARRPTAGIPRPADTRDRGAQPRRRASSINTAIAMPGPSRSPA